MRIHQRGRPPFSTLGELRTLTDRGVAASAGLDALDSIVVLV
jgi:hypothetical protein